MSETPIFDNVGNDQPEDDQKPTLKPETRDKVYIGGLLANVVVALVVGTIAIWFPDIRAQVDGTGVVILNAVGLLVSGLGVVYRPGKQK